MNRTPLYRYENGMFLKAGTTLEEVILLKALLNESTKALEYILKDSISINLPDNMSTIINSIIVRSNAAME